MSMGSGFHINGHPEVISLSYRSYGFTVPSRLCEKDFVKNRELSICMGLFFSTHRKFRFTKTGEQGLE